MSERDCPSLVTDQGTDHDIEDDLRTDDEAQYESNPEIVVANEQDDDDGETEEEVDELTRFGVDFNQWWGQGTEDDSDD